MERSREDIEKIAADMIREYQAHFGTDDVSRVLEGVSKLLEEKETKFFTQHLGILGGKDLCNVKEAIERGRAVSETAKVELDKLVLEYAREPKPDLLVAFDKAIDPGATFTIAERKVEAVTVPARKNGRSKKG